MKTITEFNDTELFDIQSIKESLLSYSVIDRINDSTSYHLGFNDAAQSLIDEVASASIGFASEIATTVKNNYYKISEKQAYYIAKAAIENNLISKVRNNTAAECVFSTKKEVSKFKEDQAQKAVFKAAKRAAKRAAKEEFKSTKNKSIEAAQKAVEEGIIELKFNGICKVVSLLDNKLTVITESGQKLILNANFLPLNN